MYISGLHAIEEYLKRRAPKGELYVSGKGKRISAIRNLAGEKGVIIHDVSKEDILRLTGVEDHRGVVLSKPEQEDGTGDSLESVLDAIVSESALIILLDGITDPHNLGAVLRSAEQFGADCVVIPKRRNVSLSDTVARVSAGAVEYVRTVKVTNLSRAIDLLKKRGFWIYGADPEGAPIDKTDLRGRIAIVLGSEGEGLSRLVTEHCDGVLSIPSKGRLDSLNVSVATGIILYEIRRQQGF